jgi:hypothetical protein
MLLVDVIAQTGDQRGVFVPTKRRRSHLQFGAVLRQGLQHTIYGVAAGGGS